jgi:hypothetical protein
MNQLNHKWMQIRHFKLVSTRFLASLGISLSVAVLIGCQMTDKSINAHHKYANPSFSRDSQKLVFDRYTNLRDIQIHVLNLNTKVLNHYQSPPGFVWYGASFSPSGEQLTFIQVPFLEDDVDDKILDWNNSQIAIMDANGENLRIMTQGLGIKKAPSFSWSGKKIIYAQSLLRQPPGKTKDVENDVFEIDLDTGVNRQLTNLHFFQMGRPSYLPGDQSFLVNADYPGNIQGVTAKEYFPYMKRLKLKSQDSQVFQFDVMDKSEDINILFGDNLFYANEASIDERGNIYFWAQPAINKKLRLYRLNADGELSSWERNGQLQDVASVISPNGRLWVTISRPAVDGDLDGIYSFDLVEAVWEKIATDGVSQAVNP